MKPQYLIWYNLSKVKGSPIESNYHYNYSISAYPYNSY